MRQVHVRGGRQGDGRRGIAVARALAMALVLLLAIVPQRQALGQGAVEGRVLSVAGVPLPFALVTLRPASDDSLLALTDAQGRFRFVSAGRLPAVLRARAIGHRPDSLVVERGGAVTLTLDLLPRTIVPTIVRAVRCNSNDLATRGHDPVLASLLEQARLNAEQFRQLATQDDFVVPTRHTLRFLLEGGDSAVRTVDSLSGSALAQPGYRRGRVLFRTGYVPLLRRGTWFVSVPLAAEMASRRFIAEHCFVYAGDDEVSGRRVRKLLVAPAERNRDADLEGELYLDAETFVLVRSNWRVTKLSPTRGPVSALHVDVLYTRSRSGLVLPMEMQVWQTINRERLGGRRIQERTDTYTYGEPAFARDVDPATWARYQTIVTGTPAKPRAP